MSFGEILLLAIVAYLVFGPKKLPEIVRKAAQLRAELRRASNDFRHSLDVEIGAIEVSERPALGVGGSEPEVHTPEQDKHLISG